MEEEEWQLPVEQVMEYLENGDDLPPWMVILVVEVAAALAAVLIDAMVVAIHRGGAKASRPTVRPQGTEWTILIFRYMMR